MIQRIDLYVSFPLVTIRIDDDMNILVFLWCYTQDGSMAQSRKFGFEMFFPQVDRIVMRVRYFICMRKRSSTFLWLQSQFAAQSCHRKGTVILGATSYYPMAVAKALQFSILIIIRCNTLFLRILSLRSPGILSVRHQYGRKGLSMFLTSLTKHASRLGIGLRCAYHRIEGMELTYMFSHVYSAFHILLEFFPGKIVFIIRRNIRTIEHIFHAFDLCLVHLIIQQSYHNIFLRMSLIRHILLIENHL